MKAIPPHERARLGKLLDTRAQAEVMAMIPQFQQANVFSPDATPSPLGGDISAVVFNVQQGRYCDAVIDFLQNCPLIQPFDIILANELDDGCTRSGNRDTTRDIAQALNMYSAYALEFIELKDTDGLKAYHGNAVFSRYPIKWAKPLHLLEEYNWYHDRQTRIGARCAVFAELDVGGKPLGVVSIHLENRTSGEGRARQMDVIYKEAARCFPDMPVLLGGDLNTNAFDGRDKEEIQLLAANDAELNRRMASLPSFEPLLANAEPHGFEYEQSAVEGATRRKPLPDGRMLEIRLDWFLSRGLVSQEARNVSTLKKDCGFASAHSALAALPAVELSDHNALWGRYQWEH